MFEDLITDHTEPFFGRKVYMKKRDLAFLPPFFLVDVRAMHKPKRPEDLLSGVPIDEKKSNIDNVFVFDPMPFWLRNKISFELFFNRASPSCPSWSSSPYAS